MGIRAAAFRTASGFRGFLDGDNLAFYYDGDVMKIRLLFESKAEADTFCRRLLEDRLIISSPFGPSNVVTTSINASQNNLGKEVVATDYDPNGFDSPYQCILVQILF
jgi:hypothetical protein